MRVYTLILDSKLMLLTCKVKGHTMTSKSHETKSSGYDLAQEFDSFRQGFEAYKETNDATVNDMKRKGSVDVVLQEKLARIDDFMDEAKSSLDRAALRSRRPAFGSSEADTSTFEGREHKKAFNAYVRSGETSNLKRLEEKALSVGSGPDGGYLVPVPAERQLVRRMSQASPIRALATVREISGASLKKAYSFAGPQAGWVAETAARTTGTTQQIADLTFPAAELFAMPAATQTLLDDGAVDIEAWIMDEVAVVFAEQEGAAFVNGDGVNKPKGFQSYTKVAQSAWVPTALGYIATGVAGAFSSTNPSDTLVDLIYSLKAGYRQNANFVLNRKTQSQIRKFKASTGEYLWLPPVSIGAPATLMGFPVTEAEDMPDIALDSTALAFGDFMRGYVIVDRMGVRILRDPYSNKPYVMFYTTKRVGGGVQDFDAIKFLKFGIS
jgi:HK97 family phage major capsid protein